MLEKSLNKCNSMVGLITLKSDILFFSGWVQAKTRQTFVLDFYIEQENRFLFPLSQVLISRTVWTSPNSFPDKAFWKWLVIACILGPRENDWPKDIYLARELRVSWFLPDALTTTLLGGNGYNDHMAPSNLITLQLFNISFHWYFMQFSTKIAVNPFI